MPVTRYYPIDHAEGPFVRVAVITDVHGNLEALRAVLAHIEQGGVDEIVVAGDTVNILPHSKACWDLTRSLGCPVLRGNHELYVYTYDTPEADPVWVEERFQGLAWVRGQFSADDLLAMRQLPVTYNLPDLLITHASPRSVFDGVSEDTPVETLREMFTQTSVQSPTFIVRGHNHGWLERGWDGRTLLTVASCGLPLSGRLEAQYALLTFREGRWEYEEQFVPYDRDAALAMMDAHYMKMMGPLGQVFKRELATGKDHLSPFFVQNLTAIAQKEVTLAAAVERFLARSGSSD